MAKRTCGIDGCERVHAARGMCLMHYKRGRYRRSPGVARVPETAESYAERNTAESGRCVLWTGAITANGYGIAAKRHAQSRLAHRFMYELRVGPIPDGYQIDHLCRTRACVNPDHLEAVPQEVNLRRGWGSRLQNGMDTACLHGHEYTPANTYINANNPKDRRCRECARIRDAGRHRHSNRKQDA